MRPSEDDRIRGLLAEGRGLLEKGRGREAQDLFGRVLLQHPGHAEARQGVIEARDADTEAARVLAQRLDEAAQAAEAGEHEAARRILEDVVAEGGDRDRAHTLLDRLDPRGGRVEAVTLAPNPPATREVATPTSALSRDHSRRAFVALCGMSFASLAVGVSSSWEWLVGSLARTPSPGATAVPSSALMGPTSGERAIAEARKLIEIGDTRGALAALERVSREEPAYPFACQLRDQLRMVSARGTGP